jgi:hypothetical protein
MSPESFMDVKGDFVRNLCESFQPKCSTGNVKDISADPVLADNSRRNRFLQTQDVNSLVNFTIKFVDGGPTIPHMRGQLNDVEFVQTAIGSEFELVLPYSVVITELTEHRSNSDLQLTLNLMKAYIVVQFNMVLLGLWALVVFWTITARGDACRKQAHSEWRANFMPTAETLQVLVLSCFLQLILSLVLHLVTPESSNNFTIVVLYGFAIGTIGAVFNAILNTWIRGESLSLSQALEVRNVDKTQSEWIKDDDTREYSSVYDAGGARGLGNLAAHDWESHHLSWEQRMGLIDLSDNCFDEVKPEKDPNLLAAFLNSTLLGAFTGKKGEQADSKKPPPVPEELQLISVEVPGGLQRTLLRDAILQWRLRHAAHSTELDAVDWLLGQLDPGFELRAVKVPEQARLLLVEALIQYRQQHADLELDACHASRVQSTLQQLSGRFQGLEVQLPDDGKNTGQVRELIHAALKHRVESSSTRDITQEEGLLLQEAMSVIGETHTLVSMPWKSGAGA